MMEREQDSADPVPLPSDEIDKDEYMYSIKKRIYQSAKEGFSLNLALHLSKLESSEIQNVLLNQV